MNNAKMAVSPKIFLLDDEPYFLYLYEQIIRRLGYDNIHSFNKSVECLDRLVEKPDIIFLPHIINALNGIDVLRKIKQFDSNIIVFMILGNEPLNIAQSALLYGALDYIVKQDINEQNMRYCLEKGKTMKETLVRQWRKESLEQFSKS